MMTVSLFFCQLVNSKQVMLKVSSWKSQIKSFVLEKIRQPRICIDAAFEKGKSKAPMCFYD